MFTRLWLASLALLMGSPPAQAVDLLKVERSIAKEPAYQSNTPKYCLLVFGRDAATRVWLVLDGNVLYVDRNGNGDLTEEGESFSKSGNWHRVPDLSDADGRTKHKALALRYMQGGSLRLQVQVAGQRMQFVGFDETDPFCFAPRPGDATIVHFDGPLTSRLYGGTPTLVPGREAELDIAVGTPGLGKGSFAAIQCCTILDQKIAPIAEIEFPPRSAADKPLMVKVKVEDD